MSVECRGGEGGNGRLLEEEVSPTFTQRAGTGAHRLHPQSPPWFLTSRLISRCPSTTSQSASIWTKQSAWTDYSGLNCHSLPHSQLPVEVFSNPIGISKP